MAIFNRKNRFEKMFEGYEQRTYIDEKGVERTRMVYIGNYYQPDITNKEFVIRKILNIVLFIISVAVIVFAGLQSIPANLVTIMAMFQGLGIVASIIAIIYLGSYTIAPYKMERSAHKNLNIKFKYMCLICLIIHIASFITEFILNSIDAWSGGFVCYAVTFAYLIAAGCSFVMWFLENKTEYIILEPDSY